MLGALIGAGATLAGGLLNRSSQKDQMREQRKYAQNAIQWRAADAEKAGISKLYALGANTASYSPVATGGGVGDALSAAGQNIGRAVDATASPTGRAGHLATELATVQIEGAKLDNEIRRQQLLSNMVTRNQPGQPPAMPNATESTPVVPGQGNSGVVLKREIAPSLEGQPHRSFGVTPEVDMWRTSRGFAPEVPQNLGEAQESQPLSALQWYVRNKVLPMFDESRMTPPYPAPPDAHWEFNPFIGEYMLVRRGPRSGKGSLLGNFAPSDWIGGAYDRSMR